MLTIHPIPAFKDNYIWVLHNRMHAVVVDPGLALPVLEYLELKKLRLHAILITHHHGDHTGGNAELLKVFDVPVYGPSNEFIPFVTHPVNEGIQINLQEISLRLTVLDTPGHTQGHITYYGSNPKNMIFCGDTLFSCGCGRVFEGSTEQMYHSIQKLVQLPDDTNVYCTHEYTLDNIRFAKMVDPDNKKLTEYEIYAKQLRLQNIPTLPTTLQLEKTINPFLRCNQPDIIKSVQNHALSTLADPLSIFSELRAWKNSF